MTMRVISLGGLLLAVLTIALASRAAVGGDPLWDGFQNPPAVARPLARWVWPGNQVSRKEILRELDVLKANGFGGVEINGWDRPPYWFPLQEEPLPWLSPEWCEMIKFTADAARDRNMVTDMLVGPGWALGGPDIPKEEQSHELRLKTLKLTGPDSFQGRIEDLTSDKDKLLFLRLVPEATHEFQPGIDLMDRVAEDGTVQFDVPPGKHRLYAGTVLVGHDLLHHSVPGGAGHKVDYFNAHAVGRYLERISSALGTRLGGKLGDGLRAIFFESIELFGPNWTGDFLEQFAKRRGYQLEPYLPFVLEGHAPEDDTPRADTLRRARYDFHKTLVELILEASYQQYTEWCHRQGLQSKVESYGWPNVYDMVGMALTADIPEGMTVLYRDDPSSVDPLMDGIEYATWNKRAASGAHLNGRPIVSCEAFVTFVPFQATLEYIKQATDLNFITGVNLSSACVYAYAPPGAPYPGGVAYGDFSEQTPWWIHVRQLTDYNARLSWVFQQTRYQGQVAILGPTADIWARHNLDRKWVASAPWYLPYLWQVIHSNGCGADFVNERVVQQASFDGGKLRYGPMAYQLLIVAEAQSMEPATAKALQNFAEAGGRILFVGRAPDRSPGLKDAGVGDAAVRDAIQAALKMDPHRVAVVKPPERDNVISWADQQLTEVGVERPVTIAQPDPRLLQTHHRVGDREVFFFSNSHRDQALQFQAHFATGDKTPWCWDPQSGNRQPFWYAERKNELTIELGPLESLLLVFEPEMEVEARRKPEVDWQNFTEIHTPWHVTLHPAEGPSSEKLLPKLVDFGLSDDVDLSAFAGVAIYRTTFDVDDAQRTMLSLGTVHGSCEAWLNGHPLGVRWYGRRVYDVSDLLKSGKNELQVKVATVNHNYCRTITHKNPMAKHWVTSPRQLQPGQEGRETVPVGMLGPVRLLHAR